jgi:ATP/ADP translocase
MNGVINSQRDTQAAFSNRIANTAWFLTATIALCANMLFGYRLRKRHVAETLAVVLPIVVAVAFLLIADIDSPRHGLIRISPENLQSLAKSLGR